jgi:hypothetical protein
LAINTLTEIKGIVMFDFYVMHENLKIVFIIDKRSGKHGKK